MTELKECEFLFSIVKFLVIVIGSHNYQYLSYMRVYEQFLSYLENYLKDKIDESELKLVEERMLREYNETFFEICISKDECEKLYSHANEQILSKIHHLEGFEYYDKNGYIFHTPLHKINFYKGKILHDPCMHSLKERFEEELVKFDC